MSAQSLRIGLTARAGRGGSMAKRPEPTTATCCPTVEDLKAFAVGDLAGARLEEIAVHVSGCPRCDASLQELDHYADGLLTDLHQLDVGPNGAGHPDPVQATVPDRLVH